MLSINIRFTYLLTYFHCSCTRLAMTAWERNCLRKVFLKLFRTKIKQVSTRVAWKRATGKRRTKLLFLLKLLLSCILWPCIFVRHFPLVYFHRPSALHTLAPCDPGWPGPPGDPLGPIAPRVPASPFSPMYTIKRSSFVSVFTSQQLLDDRGTCVRVPENNLPTRVVRHKQFLCFVFPSLKFLLNLQKYRCSF